MGSVAAIRILHRRKLAEVPPESREELELDLAAEHDILTGGVQRAVEIGVVDEIVEPVATRRRIAEVMKKTPGVRGLHGNIPL